MINEKRIALATKSIIEKVTRARQCITPIVSVTKKNGDIRIYADKRCANEKYPIQTVDEVIQDLNQRGSLPL